MVLDRGTYWQDKGTDIATGLRAGELTFTLQGRKAQGEAGVWSISEAATGS
jgi:hypothetical protein